MVALLRQFFSQVKPSFAFKFGIWSIGRWQSISSVVLYSHKLHLGSVNSKVVGLFWLRATANHKRYAEILLSETVLADTYRSKRFESIGENSSTYRRMLRRIASGPGLRPGQSKDCPCWSKAGLYLLSPSSWWLRRCSCCAPRAVHLTQARVELLY